MQPFYFIHWCRMVEMKQYDKWDCPKAPTCSVSAWNSYPTSLLRYLPLLVHNQYSDPILLPFFHTRWQQRVDKWPMKMSDPSESEFPDCHIVVPVQMSSSSLIGLQGEKSWLIYSNWERALAEGGALGRGSRVLCHHPCTTNDVHTSNH